MELKLESYAVRDGAGILTPALLIYPDLVQTNIAAMLRMADGDPRRWRPHVKTVKSPDIVRLLVANGVSTFKCATTLELRMCCESGASDVLFAIPVIGQTAQRVGEIAREFPDVSISALVESEEQIAALTNLPLGIFVDINPGMNRTGIPEERLSEIAPLARAAGSRFRGLHFYDGHVAAGSLSERQERSWSGYARLLEIMKTLHLEPGEVITSGTPAAPGALQFPGFRNAGFVHRVSPGTVVLNDMTSLQQLPEFGFVPAAIVITTVVSRPVSGVVTTDAGHKSVSADAGVPTCQVIGRPELTPLKPSEEHLPIQVSPGALSPGIGEHLYLLPHHVCPTVNLFDTALVVRSGRVDGCMQIAARGHELRVANAENPQRLPANCGS